MRRILCCALVVAGCHADATRMNGAGSDGGVAGGGDLAPGGSDGDGNGSDGSITPTGPDGGTHDEGAGPTGDLGIHSNPHAAGLDFDVFHFYPTGNHVAGTPMAYGDFNEDGRGDIATACNSDDNVVVVLADEHGGYGPPDSYTVMIASGVAVGDVDGDHHLDLIVTGQGGFAFLKGNGDGTFQMARTITGPDSISPVLRDLDGDHLLDLLIGTTDGSGKVYTYKGDGHGGFTQITFFSAYTDTRKILLADVTGDGVEDLVALNVYSLENPVVSVLPGLGGGQFDMAKTTAVAMNQASCDARDLVAGKFDGDASWDLIVVADCGITMLPGNGTAQPTPGTLIPTGRNPYSAAAADFDHDGKLDLAVLSYDDTLISVFYGDGHDGLGDPVLYSSGNVGLLGATDVDGDGWTDLVMTAPDVGVALNRGDGSFRAAPVIVPTGTEPSGMAFGDFDGDGQIDVAVSSLDSPDIRVAFGRSDGTFRRTKVASAGAASGQLRAADLDGDHKLDLVFATPTNNIGVLRGSGDGTFQKAATYAGGKRFALGDFNGDGDLDVAAVDGSNLNILINAHDGSGKLKTANPVAAGKNPYDVAAGDFDHNNKLDLAVAAYDDNAVIVFLGDGSGGFTGQPPLPTGDNPRLVAAADLRNIGKLDVIGFDNSGDYARVFLGRGDGHFDAVSSTGTLYYPQGSALGDFDLDGKIDLFYLGGGGAQVYVAPGNGDGSFAAATYYYTYFPVFVVAGDLNGDGKPDLAIASSIFQRQGYVSIFMNSSTR